MKGDTKMAKIDQGLGQHSLRRPLGIIVSSILSIAGIYFYLNRGTAVKVEAPVEQKAAPVLTPVDLTVDENGLSKSTVVLTTTRGKIKFKFYPSDAPNTVARISALIQEGFYNGLTFHRVVPGFVIQGGDPTGTGMGGTGTKLKAEFNSRKHVPGAVAMARTQDPDSADCQFYISLGTHAHLDNQYTVFGFVVEGLDVAEQIQPGDRMVQVVIE